MRLPLNKAYISYFQGIGGKGGRSIIPIPSFGHLGFPLLCLQRSIINYPLKAYPGKLSSGRKLNRMLLMPRYTSPNLSGCCYIT